MHRDIHTLVISFQILFGSGFAFVLFLGQLLRSGKSAEKGFLALFFLMNSVWQFFGGCVDLGLESLFRFNVYAVSIPCYYSSIPLIYLYFLRILDPSVRLRWKHLPHAVLPALSFLVVLPFAGTSIDIYSVMNISRGGFRSREAVLLSVTLYSATLLCLAYMALLLGKIVKLRREAAQRPRRIVDITSAMIVLIIFINILWILDRAFSFGLLPYIYVSFTWIIVSIYLLSIRYPEYLTIIRQEAERVRYARTRIKELDAGEALSRLDAILKDEKLYRDEKLSLAGLAERLGITPHQLSELINVHLGTNFFRLVDSYRIEEAKRVLREQPDRKIIAVSCDVGFNSLSAFYRAFRNEVGASPSDFRKSR